MKLISPKLIAILAIIALTNFSCSKDKDKDEEYTCTTCTSQPDAVAANDNSNKGIYKAVVIGSTGSLIFNLENSTNTISATMVLDGNVVNLTCDEEVNTNSDFEGVFTGTLKGAAVTITFSVEQGGLNPTVVSATIPEHPYAVFITEKETSQALLECFEGTYTRKGSSSNESGIYNLLIVRKSGAGTWKGVSVEDGSPEDAGFGEGFMSGNNIVEPGRGSNNEDIVIAKIEGHVMTGSFVEEEDDDSVTVTVKGKRTL